jgi:hypothetical protein
MLFPSFEHLDVRYRSDDDEEEFGGGGVGGSSELADSASY